MSEKTLQIFTLCEQLAQLLDDKEAIADLKKLYDKHPEMFKNMQEVSKTVKEVVSEPDLIMKNPNARNENDYIAVKKNLTFNQKKMGDIGIRNSDGTNIIFHANKQDKRNFNRFLNKTADGGAVHSLHTPSQAWMGGNEKSSGASTLSSTTNGIIPQKDSNSQKLVEASSAKAAPTRLDRYADKPNDLSRCNKALSASANDIIPQKDSKESQIQAMKERVKEFTLKNNKALPTNKDKSLDIDR